MILGSPTARCSGTVHGRDGGPDLTCWRRGATEAQRRPQLRRPADLLNKFKYFYLLFFILKFTVE
jgi:hypothetical protein